MHQHVYFGFKVILGIFVGIALALAFFYAGFTTAYQNAYNFGLNDGWSAAKEVIKESGIFLLADEGTKTLSLSGVISDIQGDKIFLKVENLNANPLETPTPKNRIVTATANTKFAERISKTAEEMQNDLAKFNEAREEFKSNGQEDAPPTLPRTYKENNTLAFRDLKVGDEITITALDDIKTKQSLTAEKIIKQTAAKTISPPAE